MLTVQLTACEDESRSDRLKLRRDAVTEMLTSRQSFLILPYQEAYGFTKCHHVHMLKSANQKTATRWAPKKKKKKKTHTEQEES